MAHLSSGFYMGGDGGASGGEYGSNKLFNVDVGTGANRVILAQATIPNRAALAPLSLTIGGVACSQSAVTIRNTALTRHVAFWLAGAVPEGVQSCNIVTDAGDNLGRPRVLLSVYDNVESVAAPVVVNGSGTALSMTVTTTPGQMVAALAMYENGSTAVPQDAAIERFELNGNTATLMSGYVMDEVATGTSLAINATLSSGNFFVGYAWALTAPAGGGGGSAIAAKSYYYRMLQGA